VTLSSGRRRRALPKNRMRGHVTFVPALVRNQGASVNVETAQKQYSL
jgi:hypothetical protein